MCSGNAEVYLFFLSEKRNQSNLLTSFVISSTGTCATVNLELASSFKISAGWNIFYFLFKDQVKTFDLIDKFDFEDDIM